MTLSRLWNSKIVGTEVTVGTICLVLLGLYLLLQIVKYLRFKILNSVNQNLAKKTLEQRNGRQFHFKRDIEHLNAEEILAMDVSQLRQGLIEKKFTSVDLVNFYADRCYVFGRKLSLTTQENYKSALAIAKEKDEQLEKALADGEEVGPMHGIPISVKDFIEMKGKLSTFGMTYFCDDLMKEDAIVLKQYVDAGAIPLVKGNVPHFGASMHTNNLIWGEAMNPLNLDRSPGGSSGGDAGLLVSKSIPFSIGNDSGGSMRYPAAFCGVYTVKPTQGRVSVKGIGSMRKMRFDEETHIQPVAGPMGASVEDCVVGLKIQFDPQVHLRDPFQAPSQWNNDVYLQVQNEESRQEIKIGMLQESPFLPLSDSTKRAMKETERHLKELGYKVVPFFLTDEVWDQGRDYMYAVLSNGYLDGTIRDLESEGETLMENSKLAVALFKSGPIARGLINFALKYLMNRGRVQKATRMFRKMSEREYEQVLKKRHDFIHQVSQKWQKSNLSALIAPVFPHCAFKREHADELSSLLEYTFIWNVLNFPCGVLPITRVEPEEQHFRDHFEDRWTYLLNESAKDSENMPICIQVIGHTYEDEKICGIMKVLEAKINFRINYPVTFADIKASLSKAPAAKRLNSGYEEQKDEEETKVEGE